MEVMSIAEFAQRLFVSRDYVRKLLDDGKLLAMPGPDGEPVVDREVAERYIADANARQRKALEAYLRASAEQHEIDQLRLHFDEYMHVARRTTAEEAVRVHCAYWAVYEVMRFVVSADSIGVSAMEQPDAYARAVVEHAATVLRLTPEEVRMAQTLTDWGLTGVPPVPPIAADAAVQLAERVLAASLGSCGRE